MTITINLPPATVEKLQAQAEASGKDVETFVREAVEAKLALTRVSLKEVLEPIQDAVAACGMSPEEAEAFFEQELAATRGERRASQGQR